ncbi:hypothetical protein [Arthronema virus TR020]|uniref:Uncharacterized protein n=1 Tax=Arthronema virus TR020 TaxID=2736280 RepID=A0A7G3WH14_9CAUD|nr:hypothetical protein [Arthronema virus TR020]
MVNLKSLGQSFNSHARSTDVPQSRPMTTEEETQLITALNEIVDLSDLNIEYVGESPYANEYELRLDVIVNNRFRTPVLSCPGIMSSHTYTMYRLAHDVRNHVFQSKSFSPFDELLSAFDLIQALRGKVSQYVLDFVFTDVLLINAVYAFNRRSWRTLENGKHHKVCCLETWNASSLLVPSKA